MTLGEDAMTSTFSLRRHSLRALCNADSRHPALAGLAAVPSGTELSAADLTFEL